ncbi:hypothetical protein D9757_003075 [Collybiopsis confluens]|uniref:ABC transporter domain-containing protein n=1 Tax=Collybiopsis confluens TaxID=2823264 RepID=A0A8H5HX79_9AGAR|nr:hypothetical protein D9757_003075 [Collybiopsis confluens]
MKDDGRDSSVDPHKVRVGMHTRSIPHPDGPSNDLNVDDIWTTLVRETRQISRESTNSTSDSEALSLYHGSAGFAVLARAVSSFSELGPPMDRVGRANLAENLNQISQNTLPNTVKILQSARWRPKSSSKTSYLETPVGIATEVLIDILEHPETSSSLYTEEDVSTCTDVLRRALDIQAQAQTHDEDEDDSCEVLYGQAGLLYAICRLRSCFYRAEPAAAARLASFVADTTIANIVHSIITRGRFGASLYASNVSSRSKVPSLIWSWHHKRYLGAAHGVAGILHVILLCPLNIIESYVPDILQTIEWLTHVSDDDGNWPSSMKQGYPRSNNLVQWCHGAPGILLLLATLVRRSNSHPNIFRLSEPFSIMLAAAIQKSAAVVYERGLLRKGVGLCHGVAGSVYALLAACDAMGLWKRHEHSKVYFLSGIHLAHLATTYGQLTSSGEMTTPDKPWSLYGGTAGMCAAWAEVYDRLGTAGRNLDRLEYSWSQANIRGIEDYNNEVPFHNTPGSLPRESVVALKDVTLSLPAGSRTLLIGGNGAGKSTLLYILAGKRLIQHGQVSVFGKDVFKDFPDNLTYLGTEWAMNAGVKRDIVVSDFLNSVGGYRHKDRRDRLLDILDIDLDWHMHAISDGERRRVQLCMGLMREWDLLLLDEVTVDLDVLVRDSLLKFLKEETITRNATIVYATHIFDGLNDFPTHVAHMNDGQFVLNPTPWPFDPTTYPALDAGLIKAGSSLHSIALYWLAADRELRIREEREGKRVKTRGPRVLATLSDIDREKFYRNYDYSH